MIRREDVLKSVGTALSEDKQGRYEVAFVKECVKALGTKLTAEAKTTLDGIKDEDHLDPMWLAENTEGDWGRAPFACVRLNFSWPEMLTGKFAGYKLWDDLYTSIQKDYGVRPEEAEQLLVIFRFDPVKFMVLSKLDITSDTGYLAFKEFRIQTLKEHLGGQYRELPGRVET